jgi:hypothetical protein
MQGNCLGLSRTLQRARLERLTVTELNADLLTNYPRSANYDLTWVMQHLMGPNVLWLTEYLTQVLDLKPGMRIDAGRALGFTRVVGRKP